MTRHRDSVQETQRENCFDWVKSDCDGGEVSEGGKVVEYAEDGEDFQELDHKCNLQNDFKRTHLHKHTGLYSLLELDDCLRIFETDSTISRY